ncbi:MAG: hypothetical protein H7210_05760 [Pyrinomonadaceae bacterium]|nr:hypothetical protein [Phycisphaerales bacterium]
MQEHTSLSAAVVQPSMASGYRASGIVTAVVLAVLVVVRLSMLAAPAQAADVVSQAGDYTILTLAADNDDVLVVLDGRNETLSAYRVKNKSSLDLVEARELKNIFLEGRRIGPGK